MNEDVSLRISRIAIPGLMIAAIASAPGPLAAQSVVDRTLLPLEVATAHPVRIGADFPTPHAATDPAIEPHFPSSPSDREPRQAEPESDVVPPPLSGWGGLGLGAPEAATRLRPRSTEYLFGTAKAHPARPWRDVAGSPDLAIARAIRATDLQESGTAAAVAGVFRLASLPGTLLLAGALYGIGELQDRSDLSDLGLHTGQAVVGAGVVTLAGKVVAGRARPRISPDDASEFGLGRGLRGNDFQSFPSAHTAAAFAAGTVLATDIADRHPGSGRWVYPSVYTAASMAGLSRLFDEEHWASDIAVGAVIGIASGLLVN